jgi:hypothetical protein
MFARLLDAMHADLEQQLAWARTEAWRQGSHAVLTLILTAVASLAGLGAAVVGLIAFYTWLATQHDQFTALGATGGGLLLLALILLVLARIRQRPRIISPPPLRMAQPATLLGISTSGLNSKILGSEEMVNLATATLRNGSRSALLGTLVIVTMMGVIIGRRVVDRGN